MPKYLTDINRPQKNTDCPDSLLPAFTPCQREGRKPTSLSLLLLQHILGSCNSECPRTFLVASQQDVFRFVWGACHLCSNCHPDTDTVALWDHRSAASLESLTVISVISCSRRASLYLAQVSTFWVNIWCQLVHTMDAEELGVQERQIPCIVALQIVNEYFYMCFLSIPPLWNLLWAQGAGFDLNNCWKFSVHILQFVRKSMRINGELC